MRSKILFVLTAGILMFSGNALVAQTFDELATAGEEAINAGRYNEGIRLYERIVEKGVTYENIMTIKFELAWAYYTVGSFAKAIPLFLDLSGPRAPSEQIKQQSIFLMAECHARLAETLADEPKERKKNIEEALKLHTSFQADYAASDFIPQSLYGRAFAYYLDNQMDKAEADLRTVITKHPASTTRIDAYYLLASVYSQQGLSLIQAGKREEAKSFLDKAREIFNQLTKQQSNLAMANDSTFSLAETWFSAGLYLEAIQYFREVRSKAEVLHSLRTTREELQTRLAAQMNKGENTSQTKTEINRVSAQLSSVTENPDRMIASYLRIASAFDHSKRYDEVRVICRHLLNFAQDTQKTQANIILINSYIQEKLPEDAAREAETFHLTFGNDPMAESINLAIGQLFVLQGDLPNAAQQLALSVEEYPDAPTAEEALYLKATVAFMMQNYPDVIATADLYAEKFPEGDHLPTMLYYKGMSQDALEESEVALATLTDVLTRFPEKTEHFDNLDEVAYQKGALLERLQKTDEALKFFEEFAEKYKDSSLRPYALYQLGTALNNADRFEEAQKVLRQISAEHPEHEMAPTAIYHIGVMHYQREEFEDAAKVMQELIKLFPNSPLVAEAYFWLGFIAKQDSRFEEAVAFFEKSLETDPDSARAPESLLYAAQSLNEKVSKMIPAVLPEEQKVMYRQTQLEAASKLETMLEQYPDSEKTLEAIPALGEVFFELTRTKQMANEDVDSYFKEAGSRHTGNINVQSQLMFSYGSFLMKNREEAKALAVFKEALALHPAVHLAPEMLSDYANSLKDTGELAAAGEIYHKIIEEYGDLEQALAPAWFGLADIQYLEKNYDSAKIYFEKVLNEYPWYKPGRQGRVKLAAIYEANQDYVTAEQKFTEVYHAETGDARLAASMGVARCQLARAAQLKRANDPSWRDMAKVASENLTKITVLYVVHEEFVSEAYYHLGRACELTGDINKAKEMYKKVVDDYAKYPPAKEAGEQLRRLGG